MAMFTKEQLYNDQNVPRTKALFSDFGVGEFTILSLDVNDKGMVPLRPLYVNLTVDDPSEAKFAETVFGDIIFWERLKKVPWMAKALESWRHESEVKRKSIAFEYIVDEIRKDGRNGFSAAKYLIDEPWKPKNRKTLDAKRKSSAEAADKTHVTDIAEFIRNREAK